MRSENSADQYKLLVKLKESNLELYNNWDTIKKAYANTINYSSVIQTVGFTPHDYNFHCVNIYQILSNVLIADDLYKDFLNDENLFVLCVAVLFHDFYMALDSTHRYDHAKKAADLFLEKVYTPDSLLATQIEDRNIAKAIAYVIYGHSDIKNSVNNNTETNTIDELVNIFKDDYLEGEHGDIKVVFLAGLLRIADELDIQYSRVLGKSYELRRINEDSINHWKKCELFSRPTKNRSYNKCIDINIDSHKFAFEEDKENAIKEIIEVETKINGEFGYLFEKVFNNNQFSCKSWLLKEVRLKGDKEVLDQINEYKSKQIIKENAKINEQSGELLKKKIVDNLNEDKEHDVKLDDNNILGNKIHDWVLENNLFKSGHYIIDETEQRFARDWIDLHTLFEKNEYFREIAKCFYEQLDPKSKYYIIGVNFYGMLFASYIGFKSKSKFSYFISKSQEGQYGEYEKIIEPSSGEKIIIVTDVIVTGKGLSAAIKELESLNIFRRDQIEKIFCVFYRKPLGKSVLNLETDIISKLYILNKDFDIELCKKDNCSFKKFGINQYINKPKE